MVNELSYDIDLSNVEEADDGDTTSFGGFYVLNGLEHRAYGCDRDSWNYLDDIQEAIQQGCEHAFGERLDEEELLDALMGIEHALLIVTKPGDSLVITIET